jgi:hypothetical protein
LVFDAIALALAVVEGGSGEGGEADEEESEEVEVVDDLATPALRIRNLSMLRATTSCNVYRLFYSSGARGGALDRSTDLNSDPKPVSIETIK